METINIENYVNEIANRGAKIEMIDFFRFIRNSIFPNIEPAFFEYFLTICKERGYVIHHSKLFEYGITSSNSSTHALERIRRSNLIEGKDFQKPKLPILVEEDWEFRIILRIMHSKHCS